MQHEPGLARGALAQLLVDVALGPLGQQARLPRGQPAPHGEGGVGGDDGGETHLRLQCRVIRDGQRCVGDDPCRKHIADALDADCVQTVANNYPNNRARKFLEWFTYSDNSIDGQSKKKAYTLIESGLLDSMEPGTVKCLQQIHAYLFGGLYDFAGQIRTKTIWKDGTLFCRAEYLMKNLSIIEAMPENTFDEIANKYVEMNVAHPFMEGNGRSTRLWLDLLFKKRLKLCVDWSKIDKKEYLAAMRLSTTDSSAIKALLQRAMTDKIDDREIFMKGIDYSYYYEQED